MDGPTRATTPDATLDATLDAVIDDVAHLLPAQGPISIFIHHNTLHAFEHLPFEQAVVEAGELFGCEPFLAESRYREELARGRIREADIATELASVLGERGQQQVAEVISRVDLRRRIAAYGIPEARGPALDWLLGETEALERFRDDLPPDAREVVAAARGWSAQGNADEPVAVRMLWQVCQAAIERSSVRPESPRARARVRHRDVLLARHELDIDERIHPLLIRFVAAFIDQGMAQLPLRGRENGMFACFLDTYDSWALPLCDRWTGRLGRLIADERSAQRSPRESLLGSLQALGVSVEEQREYLCQTALALRGFAGMVRQLEERPDRVPGHAVPASLLEFLAVRLLLERAALTDALAELRVELPLSSMREQLGAQLPQPSPPSLVERAWPVFHVAQLSGLDASRVASLTPAQVGALELELAEFNGNARREILHRAYERHLRQRFYDALSQHPPTPAPREPVFQAAFCIDEREESIRRHLEEVEPEVETFGAAGFYGVAMYYRGTTDAHPRPLCPVAIQPQHYIVETRAADEDRWSRWRRWRRRQRGFVDNSVRVGSHTLLRGAIIMTALGAFSMAPLILRVLFPRLQPKVAKLELPLGGTPTRLALERQDTTPPLGRYAGYVVEEMTAIVASQLENMGVGAPKTLAPLVLIMGHGSVSLNNPHESAHDCGACGGGHGGPNARALAQMANDPRVRERLSARGIEIPATTWFVGGERNTANNAIDLYDLDLVPAALHERLARARRALEHARRREAHERSRRFEHASFGLSSSAALRHVEGRAADLAQVRPEYGHASNAVCFVGRRSRTRGLFLDRRAFLVSYDPTRDPKAEALARLIGAGVPVIAGISLEYYFSYVDPQGYGCGTKLPHNVTALLGVMNGAQSDLRTGLPWQMVEIHEPVRMSIVVEVLPEVLQPLIDASPEIARLLDNRWLYLACLDPDSSQLWEYGPRGFEPCASEAPVQIVSGDSRDVYRARAGHLPFVRIVDTTHERSEQPS